MNDTAVSTAQGVARRHAPQHEGRTWLLLIHQLPAEPAYLRVKVLRRLRAMGAVALKSSVYVLPDGDGTREDFHWLRREIVAGGGTATLTVARCLEGISDDELEVEFTAERNAEYVELAEDIDAQRADGGSSASDVERLRRRLGAIQERDYFGAPARHAALRALAALERGLAGDDGDEEVAVPSEKPRAATWVTRTGVRIDRLASAWLIRRFIDPAAAFRFVAPDAYTHRSGELRFDMYEGEYTHEGDRCTFETLLRRFDLAFPGLRQIAEIVHDIDCRDEKYGRAETAGVASVIAGLVAVHARDEDRIGAALPLFDGLLARFQSSETSL